MTQMSDELRQLIERAAMALKAAGAREVYVSGSAARGQMCENSDIDLAVSGLPPELFYRAGGQAEHALECLLDLVDLDEDTPFTRYLKEKSVLLRDQTVRREDNRTIANYQLFLEARIRIKKTVDSS